MTTCLILAAGEAERHNGGNKPLLEVRGKTLLDRTVGLCEKWLFRKPFIVTHNKAIMDSQPDCTCWIPAARRWVIETLFCTRMAWSQDSMTIALLGDVFYTKHAFSDMVLRRDLTAFGKGCNIHALRWGPEYNDKLAGCLERGIKYAESKPRTHGAGKLWLLVECNGIELIDFGDETTDFDSPQEHKRFIAKYGNRNLRTTEASKAR